MVKKIREFHYNEGENISGESIGVVALIRGRRLIEGGAYSSKYGKPIFKQNEVCAAEPFPLRGRTPVSEGKQNLGTRHRLHVRRRR